MDERQHLHKHAFENNIDHGTIKYKAVGTDKSGSEINLYFFQNHTHSEKGDYSYHEALAFKNGQKVGYMTTFTSNNEYVEESMHSVFHYYDQFNKKILPDGCLKKSLREFTPEEFAALARTLRFDSPDTVTSLKLLREQEKHEDFPSPVVKQKYREYIEGQYAAIVYAVRTSTNEPKGLLQDHQGQGIGGLLYAFVSQCHTANNQRLVSSVSQSPDARSLWANFMTHGYAKRDPKLKGRFFIVNDALSKKYPLRFDPISHTFEI